ncbi:hypothetical protein V1J52_21695 [Streptomyces sp. TRM 70351]|uniref:hypothetical protein n=1 Tax=Streptomyces sp. TRM 70351 TaxID=3116552 RepID=UPI002E7B31B7|nr:hypothetical protein [Streptomyces sp. TRM 70351]MEE1930771.1 hypothetical protein [Streptomyces sp. TRM 70351]
MLDLRAPRAPWAEEATADAWAEVSELMRADEARVTDVSVTPASTDRFLYFSFPL